MNSATEAYTIARLTSILACVAFLGVFWLEAQTRDNVDDRVLSPLVSEGISVNDSAALIRTIKGNDPNLAARAAYALGKLPDSKDAVAALTSAIRDVPVAVSPSQEGLWESTAVYAAEALVRLHEKDWIPIGRARLNTLKDRVSRIQMSAYLASQGCYDGWPMVRDSLLERPYDYSALMAVPSFVGMKRTDGSEMDLAAEIERLVPSMREDRRKLALSKITEIRAKTTR